MEDETLRLLLIHADKFEYEAKEKAVKEPESLPDHAKKGTLQDGLVVFCTVEKADEASPENTATNAAASIEEVLGWLKTKRVMIYPYAHLSTDLAGREPAIATLKILEAKLSEKGYEVSRAPFGWYKSFTISAKGHPLSEHANQVKRKIAITTLNVRGTNMFDVDEKPIKEHLQLFGSRAYELDVDERPFVLRYAFSFQQFPRVKDWTLSYRPLPFGTF